MLRNTRVLVSLGLVLGAAGCNGFLTGEKLSTNPNSPASATIATLFVAMQGAQFGLHEGQIAMQICEWVQACGGTSARFVELGGRYDYGNASNIGANSGDWSTVYDAGGLVDMRNMKAGAGAAGDSVYLGITKIYEAFTIGMATDLWSGIPYTQAGVVATPDTDSQFAVYDSVQALLTQALNELAVDTVSTHGPLTADFVFGGLATQAAQRAAWRAVAWTMKARYWLHVVNAAANGKLGGLTAAQVYANAIAAADSGISQPSGSGDFSGIHFGPQNQQNMWAQFQEFSGFGSDLEAGKPLVDYMNARADPRVPLYFCKNKVGGYGGDSFNQAINSDSVSNYVCLPPRFGPTASVPYVTYAENQLILAEAYNQTGNDVAAQAALNAELATVPLPSVAATVVGPALLDSIMMEKWVMMFQNIETLLDYRRTCIPNITFVASNFLGISFVPQRLFYPNSERNVNPAHIPLESQELAAGLRTQADVSTTCHP